MEARDAQVVSLAGQLQVEDYKHGPFSADSVKVFLSEATRRLREQEERVRQEKVRVQQASSI